MIICGERRLYDEMAGCDVTVYYDLLETGDRMAVFLYDNLCRYLGAHAFSAVSFRKCPDYWIERLYTSLSAGCGMDLDGDGWPAPPDCPFCAHACGRSNGQPEVLPEIVQASLQLSTGGDRYEIEGTDFCGFNGARDPGTLV